jgi:hypothetical protein
VSETKESHLKMDPSRTKISLTNEKQGRQENQMSIAFESNGKDANKKKNRESKPATRTRTSEALTILHLRLELGQDELLVFAHLQWMNFMLMALSDVREDKEKRRSQCIFVVKEIPAKMIILS